MPNSFPIDIPDLSPTPDNPDFPKFDFPGFPDGFFDGFLDGFPDGLPDFSDFPDFFNFTDIDIPDPWFPTVCEDDKKKCEKYAKKNKCMKKDKDGEENYKSCKKSCYEFIPIFPFCFPDISPPTDCKDDKNFEWKEKSCKKIARKKKCDRTDEDGEKLHKSCKESCGKCPKPPTLSLSPISFTETPTGSISGTGPTETPTGGTDLDPTTSPMETLTTSPTKTLTTSPTKTLTTSPTETLTTSPTKTLTTSPTKTLTTSP